MRVDRYRRLGFGAAALIGALGAGAAFAQPPPVPTYPECTTKASPQDNELAKNAHKLAAGYYDRADYDKAIQYWNEALKFDCSVNDLLINIANAYEKKGDRAATIATLETYLKRTGPNPVLEQKVKNIKAQMAPPQPSATATLAPTATATATPTATAIPTAPPPSGPRPFGNIPWAVVGGGGALAIVGAILIPVGLGKINDATSKCPLKTLPDGSQTHDCGSNTSARDEGNSGQAMAGAGYGLLGVGLAAAAGGLVWQLAFNKPGSATAKTGLWVSPTTDGRSSSGLLVGGSF